MKQRQFNRSKVFRFKRFQNKAYSAFNSMHKVVNIGVAIGFVLSMTHSMKVTGQTTASDSISPTELKENALDEVIVTASRIELSSNQVTRLITVITKDEIKQAPVQSIQDLLNYATGIDVLQRCGHGVQADISIRGGSFDQTAILLNGVNLSNPQTGHYSFDIPINLNDIERIEIIHGPSSLVYGASAFSGGINIITKKKPDHRAYGKIQAGSHKLFGTEAGISLNGGVSSNQLSVGYNTSDGYIQNSDYSISNVLWQTNLHVEKSEINIQLGYNDKRYGANTFYSPTYPNQYDKTNSSLASIKATTGDRLKFIPSIYWSRHNDCFQLYRDGTPDIPSWYTGHNYHRTDVYGSNLNLQYSSIIGITSFGAEFRNEGIVSNVLGKTMETPDGKYTKSDNRTNISYALEHNLLLRKFSLTVGILTNHNTSLNKNYKFYPSIGSSYTLTDNLKIFGSWSKATRMPTFTDLYYNTKTHSGNENLKPEYSESAELGFKYANSFISAYITTYLMKGDNLIDWIKTDADAKWQSVNLATIDKKGIEIGARINLHALSKILYPKTTLQVGYARLHQSGDNISGQVNSNYVLNYLRDKFTAQLELPLYKHILTTNWNFRWQKRMGNYEKYNAETNTSNLNPYPAFSVLDFRINYNATSNLTINLDMNNLYNTHYFDLGNIPQSGFWMMCGISYTLR
ncbi:MAG: TonB-dependent receptor plug domain-containing protein [Dysgonomonas sp.]